MPKLPLEIRAVVDKRGMLVDDKGFPIDIDLLDYAGAIVKITIEKFKPIRSLAMNSYYWAEVVPKVRLGLENAGYQLSEKGVEQWYIDYIITAAANNNSAHEYLKKRFIEIARTKKPDDDEVTTKDLKTDEFKKYVGLIVQFAAEHLDIQIMQPGEQGRMSLNDA